MLPSFSLSNAFTASRGRYEACKDEDSCDDKTLLPVNTTDDFRKKRKNTTSIIVYLLCLTTAALVLFGSSRSPFTAKARTSQDILSSEEIPNIAHFTLVGTGDGLSTFSLRVGYWLSIWSTYYYMRPDRLLVHVNYDEHVIAKARENPADEVTRAFFNIPGLEIVHFKPVTQTSKGFNVTHPAHISDFRRIEALTEFGGVYQDADSFLIRDNAPLRKSGYHAVVGYQRGRQVCNGHMMGTADSPLFKAFKVMQDLEFDKSWDKGSVHVVTRLAHLFATRGALLLPQNALFPLDWDKKQMQELYKPKQSSPLNLSLPSDRLTTSEAIDAFYKATPDDLDWSESFAIHGWFQGLRNFPSEGWFGETSVLNLEYLFRRESTFAAAVWPALRAAVLSGNIRVTPAQLAMAREDAKDQVMVASSAL